MAKNKKTSKAQYGAYQAKSSYSVNKKRKLARHLKNHPNDTQAASALKDVRLYVRKKSNNKLGWVSETIKASLAFIPQYTPKGHMIGVRKPEDEAELLKRFGQSVPMTKSFVQGFARILSDSHTIMFQQTYVYDDEKQLTLKHVHKVSNFVEDVKAA